MWITRKLGLIILAAAQIGLARAEMLSLERDGSIQIVAKVRSVNAQQYATGESIASVQFSYNGTIGPQIASIGERLPLTVKEEGFPVDIALHLGLVDGHPAVMTLDNGTIRISYSRASGKQGERIHTVLDGNQVSEWEWKNETRHTEEPLPIDTELETPFEFRENEDGFDTSRYSEQPITIFVFKHNDVRENVPKLTQELFSWWVKQMDEVNKRHISKGGGSLFGELVVDYRSDRQIQEFDYQGIPTDRLRALAKEFQRYKRESGIYGSYRRNKFLLLTEKMMDRTTLGIAYVGGQYGMASDDDDQVAAHEIGHMFNGLHEHADIRYNGWWCETILYWQHVPPRTSCHSYTDKNMDVIADYLD